jgi:hypothetical protein
MNNNTANEEEYTPENIPEDTTGPTTILMFGPITDEMCAAAIDVII